MFGEMLLLAIILVAGVVYHSLAIRQKQPAGLADYIGMVYFWMILIASAISGRGWIDESDIVTRTLSGLTCVCINVSILALWQVHLIRICKRQARSKERVIVGIIIAGLFGAIAWFCFGKDVIDLPTQIVGTSFGFLTGGALYGIYCLWHSLKEYPTNPKPRPNSRSSSRLPYGLLLGLPIVAAVGPTILFLGGVFFSACLTETLLGRKMFTGRAP